MRDEDLLWPNWVEFLRRKPNSRFIAQGTLINKHSIGKTIGSANLAGPVLALGVRRVFNFALMDENYKDRGGRYERSGEKDHRATLNIVHGENSNDKVNGILFSISPGEIDPLAQREFGYDLTPVDFEREDERGSAYMFIARKESKVIGHRVMDDILPNESSLETCLTGAATYGEAFLDTWIASCYLGDGTPLLENSYYQNFVREFVKTL